MNKNGKKKTGLFDFIAPIYGLFYARQKKKFSAVLRAQTAVDIFAYKSAIDVGCGTGALCNVLSQKGLAVTGLDSAQKMLNIAQENNIGSGIKFIRAGALETFPVKEKSFDISFASYVAHGMSASERRIMYEQMSRVTKHFIIIYDYNKKRSAMTSFIEWLERGDYFYFIKHAQEELEEQFSSVRVVNVDKRASWYICVPHTKKAE